MCTCRRKQRADRRSIYFGELREALGHARQMRAGRRRNAPWAARGRAKRRRTETIRSRHWVAAGSSRAPTNTAISPARRLAEGSGEEEVNTKHARTARPISGKPKPLPTRRKTPLRPNRRPTQPTLSVNCDADMMKMMIMHMTAMMRRQRTMMMQCRHAQASNTHKH